MDPYLWQLPLLFAVGVIAGILNVLAGGGSLLTLPLLIFMGLPGAMANGTNRIAIFCQNIFAIRGFRQRGMLPLQLALLCTPPALLGSWFGANLAISLDDQLFKRILALIMIGVMVFTALDPMKRFRREDVVFGPLRKLVLVISFFGVGVYGGFVQAGVGFLVITALLVHGLDLVRINAVKVFVIFTYTFIALGVFIYHDQINWALGLALAAGNSVGGVIGPRLAVARGHDWIKKVVTVTVLVFALKLLLFP
ncbi:integrase [Geothermobacter hydrogeniphilus]|uniref:Probable membrane transporter protein n=1 Tax=Geothermobacter hydrogeniphilus TaxID=1969733 RepID=A0A2K2H791_9BACT|nr:sulfite exporter TauE/SafE family protein [Geothermobacter hydrogeniphilus]PNU19093.1 integrase [Geothermobacter hydrogeniphilus]